MDFISRHSARFNAILVILLTSAGLYLTSRYSYVLFHTLAELFTVAIAWSAFTLAWNARRRMDDTYLLFVGIAYLFAGGLDLVHTLAYKGLGIFTGYDTDLPTQLWIAARYLQSLSLLAAPWVAGLDRFWKNTAAPYALLAGYAAVTALVLLSIFTGVFPVCFIEGVGQTPFKIASEYIISLILIASLVFLLRRRARMDPDVMLLLGLSLVSTVFSELAFTSYVDVYGPANLVGHLLKFVAFYLLYLAIIQTGLDKPHRLLYRELQASRDALSQAEEKWRLLIENAPEVITTLSPDGHVLFANRGLPPDPTRPLVGANLYQLYAGEEQEETRRVLERVFTAGESQRYETHLTLPDGMEVWYLNHLAPLRRGREILAALCISSDITRRKQAQDALSKSEAHARHLADENARLLREVNHRVGNNLNLLLLLIESQLEHPHGQETQDALFDLRARIQSMASVHRLLQETHWQPISLEHLADQVVYSALDSLTDSDQIRMEIVSNDGSVPVESRQAFKLALVLNELVTNSIKYGFSAQQTGKVTVYVGSEEKDDRAYGILEFSDDGPGWPEDVLNGERENIGLHLIRATIEYEMKGQVVLSNRDGAVTRCIFRLVRSDSR